MEKCIMPQSDLYKTERFYGSHRHEVFFNSNRQKSIEDGLVVFLTPQQHNLSKESVHYNREFDLKLKKIAEQAWLDYYGKTIEDFIKRYGRNYL
ncbi:MAG: hypothetical protein IKW45_06520 [Clostridia bacterium]|nr:hypothetical protein [Clostridia bacterium]